MTKTYQTYLAVAVLFLIIPTAAPPTEAGVEDTATDTCNFATQNQMEGTCAYAGANVGAIVGCPLDPNCSVVSVNPIFEGCYSFCTPLVVPDDETVIHLVYLVYCKIGTTTVPQVNAFDGCLLGVKSSSQSMGVPNDYATPHITMWVGQCHLEVEYIISGAPGRFGLPYACVWSA